MNTHHTKYKGDLTVARVTLDLIEKRWFVLQPVISEHLPFDIVAYKLLNGVPKWLRIQVKASPIFDTRPAPGRKGIRYTAETIDLFASYIEDVDCCVYFPMGLLAKATGHTTVTSKVPNSATPFWWYEDFTDPDANLLSKKKSTFRRFRDVMERSKPAFANSYVKYPPLNQLQQLVWKHSFTKLGERFSCSDVGIRKHCIKNGLILPPQGYFAMSETGKADERDKVRASVVKLLKKLGNTQ